MFPTNLSTIASKISQIPVHETSNINILGVSVDSRLTKPGDLFFPLTGNHVDGHDYIQHAVSRGAVACVVDRSKYFIESPIPKIPVENTFETLQLLAQKSLVNRKGKIIGITGSVGKTTTKDFLTSILQSKGKVAATPGNSNSQIGLPLVLLNHVKGDEKWIILEMGMTHAGNISKLVQIAPPDLAIITTVALVHAGNFNSIEDIAQAKLEIFSHPNTKIKIADQFLMEMLPGIGSKGNVITFSSENSLAQYFISEGKFSLEIVDEKKKVFSIPFLPVLGKHNQHNFLAAAVAARGCGLSWNEIAEAVHTLRLPERRLQKIEKNGVFFINDAYNASEKSLKVAFRSLPPRNPQKKRIAVLGEMLELGKFSRECHQRVGEDSLEFFDMMFCLGKECNPIVEVWRSAEKPVQLFIERMDLVDVLKSHIQEGDLVLLKGSRLNQLWKVIDEIFI